MPGWALGLDPLDVGPEGPELGGEIGVAPLDVVWIEDGRGPVGVQGGQHERGTGPGDRLVACTGAPESRGTPRTTA